MGFFIWKYYNLSYNVCIRQEEGYCCVRYSLCADTSSWDLNPNPATISGSGTECSYDYVGIQGVSATCTENSSNQNYKICGGVFGVATIATAITANAAYVCGKF